MIDLVSLHNFKCFRDVGVPLGNLTIFSGLNGSGKSSVLQSLLILRQSHMSGYLERGRLLLAGDLVDLGTGVDVLCEEAKDDEIGIAVVIDGRTESFHFTYNKDSNELAETNPAGRQQNQTGIPEALFGRGFSYVRADRLGPRKTSPMSEVRVSEGDIGAGGEFVMHSLVAHGMRLLASDDPRIAPISSSCTLADQVDAWMQEVAPGSHLVMDPMRVADLVVGGFQFSREGDIPTRAFRPTNVGFGLSYSLPIIYALIAAPLGGLVIIENPEAHLHPRGQTRLGQLAALAASFGVQVLVETHSDHFVDGVRIEVRKRRLDANSCKINYFVRDGALSHVDSPTIDDDGRLSHWPVGFFDQQDENLANLIAPLD